VTAPPHLAATRIAPLIRRFTHMHPGVSVELITTIRVLNFVQEKIDRQPATLLSRRSSQ
jgi:DNA-binding transcriptional LysR family regulator